MKHGEKINVLFVMIRTEMGGAERLIHNLILHLDRNIFSPSIVFFYGEILKEFSDLGVPVYHVPKVKRFDFSTIRKLAAIIRENNIHVVNAHHFMPMLYSFYGSTARRAKLFCTFHSEWEIANISLKWRLVGNLLLRHADGAIGVSREVARAARKILSVRASEIFTISNGVDSEAFKSKDGRLADRKTLGLKESDIVIGTVANFKTVKNHIFLLRAFSGLVKEHENARLMLIGRGFDDPDNTEREIRKYIITNALTEKVLLLGYRPDIARLLPCMDIFCLPSLKEGLPIGLIEAMAAGLPVVGTNVEGIRDVILPKNGFIVELNDTVGLQKALSALVKDARLRERLGRASRSQAVQNYSLQRCIEQYQNLFASPLRQSGAIGLAHSKGVMIK